MRDLTVLFDGFGGANIGAEAAGLKVVAGVENDPAIAQVAKANLDHEIIIDDVLNLDPRNFIPTWALHASPPCPNFSLANSSAGETALDIAMGSKIAEFIRVMQPAVFTLENVYLYRKSESWAVIRNTLRETGYWFDLAHINAADFGVPQTRKRMIVRAWKKGFLPQLPAPEEWIGWYEAIEDLIPDLPESQFADWQLSRIPDELSTFLIDCANSGAEVKYKTRNSELPSQTLTTGTGQLKAFLIGQGERSKPISQDQPNNTITSNHNQLGIRAWLSEGHIVSMTPRALARFQTFPDWYQFPDNKTLACKGIGNAVPPLLYEKLISQLL